MSGEPEPHRDCPPADNTTSGREISTSRVYWSIGTGIVLCVLVMLVLELFPLRHHLAFIDAFNIAWKIALLPPGVVTARIAIERINLSTREHKHAVQVAFDTEFDATQRRITELSAKASDQLASDKATVRIGGLTDLERLGQSNPGLQQTVIDRICAYLQMPYTMPTTVRSRSTPEQDQLLAPDDQPGRPQDPELRQEMKVRLTAQRILIRHVTWPQRDSAQPKTFWCGIKLDLSDADLIDFYMSDCRIVSADFAGAVFHGDMEFVNTAIDGDAVFSGARFESANFKHAKIGGYASFGDTIFSGQADFLGAIFAGFADFFRAELGAETQFSSAKFDGGASFRSATFKEVYFSGTTFGKSGVSFTDATLTGWAYIAQLEPIPTLERVADLNLLERNQDSGLLIIQKSPL